MSTVRWDASWIWGHEEASPKNYYLQARGAFHCAARDEGPILLHISAETRYKLYVNGTYVARGSVRSDPRWQYFDTHDISGLVADGDNAIAVLVHYIGIPSAHGINTQGGLICQVEQMTDREPEILCHTDASWKVIRANGWKLDAPVRNTKQDFVEMFDARKEPADWYTRDYDDRAWKPASIVGAFGPETRSWVQGSVSHAPRHPVSPWETLVPRDIPLLAEERKFAQHIVAIGETISAKGDADPATAIAAGLALPLQVVRIENADQLLAENPGQYTEIVNYYETSAVGTQKQGRDIHIRDSYIVLDFGKQVNGYFRLVLEGAAGGVVDIGYSEFMWDGRVTPFFKHGGGCNADRYTMRGGLQEWETFMWRSFRYVHLAFRRLTRPVKLHEANLVFSTYPVEYRGEFDCSEPLMTRIWETARYTCQLCMMDAYMDNPSDEQRHYIQTGYILSAANYAAFGDLKLTRKMLIQMAQSQMMNGCIQVAWPDSWASKQLNVNFVDAPLLYIVAIWDYFLYSGDSETLQSLYPAMVRQMEWFARWEDEASMLGDLPTLVWIDHADMDRRGKSAVVNAWYYLVLEIMEKVSGLFGGGVHERKYKEKAEALRSRFHSLFWNENRGLYVDCVVDGQQSVLGGEQTNAAVYWAGLGETPLLGRVLDGLYGQQGASPQIVMGSPLFQFYILEAWFRLGQGELALGLMQERLQRLITEGASTFGTMWTTLGPHVACQSEASAHAYVISTYLLGVKPLAPGFREFGIFPQPSGLSWAQGRFPSPLGDIRVGWCVEDDGFHLEFTVPEGAVAYVGIPMRAEEVSEISNDGIPIWSDGCFHEKLQGISASTPREPFIAMKAEPGVYRLHAR
jgi:hypothetical protein